MRRRSDVLRNGRNGRLRFEEMWAKVPVSLVIRPAWRGLSASAKDVYLIMIVKNGYAVKTGSKDPAGRPKFSFSYQEAQDLLGMPSPTFHRALQELQSKGFLCIAEYGGVLCGRGRAAKYIFSKAWEQWRPPKCNKIDMSKARAARAKKNEISGLGQKPT